MATPVGYAQMTAVLDADGDDEPYNITWAVETDLGNASALDHVNDALAYFTSALRARFPTSYTLTAVRGSFGQDGTEDLIVTSTTPGLAGTATFQPPPQNVACLVRKVTGLGGRRNRGRCYFPGILDETTVNAVGVITTVSVTAVQTAMNNWLTTMETGDGGLGTLQPMVILHSPPSGGGSAAAPTPVAQLEVDSLVATQRRRLRR